MPAVMMGVEVSGDKTQEELARLTKGMKQTSLNLSLFINLYLNYNAPVHFPDSKPSDDKVEAFHSLVKDYMLNTWKDNLLRMGGELSIIEPSCISSLIHDEAGTVDSYAAILKNHSMELEQEILKEAHKNPELSKDFLLNKLFTIFEFERSRENVVDVQFCSHFFFFLKTEMDKIFCSPEIIELFSGEKPVVH